ncbi:MAG: metal ABC transporter permease, partial [Promethearchaeota archaeon]
MIYEYFFDALMEFTFLQRALITSILVGVICGLVGVYIILRQLVFMG